MTAPAVDLPGWGRATWHWAAASGTRALKTLIQTFVGAISGTALFTSVDFKVVGTSAVVAALASFAQSLDGLPEVPQGSAPLSAPPQVSAAAAATAPSPSTTNPDPASVATSATADPPPAWPVDTDTTAAADADAGAHRAAP